jgi:hypothetical protein
MGEENIDTDEVVDTTEVEDETVDTSKNTDDSAGKASEEKTAEENKDDDGKKAEDPEKPSVDANEEPQTRKRNIDFIRQRQAKKAEKAAEKGKDAGEDDDDDFETEEDEKIHKIVEKTVSPLVQKAQQEEDNREIADFLSENPDLKPYETKVRKFMQHESRKALPISSIFFEVAGNDLLKIGAARERKAAEKAKQTQAGGGTTRSGDPKGKSVLDMTPAEFAAEQQRVRMIQRDVD